MPLRSYDDLSKVTQSGVLLEFRDIIVRMVKIQAHVLYFSSMVVIGTAAALGISRTFGQSDEEKEAMLRAKYPERTKQSEAQRAEMQKFFDKMKENNAKRQGEQDDQFRNILMGGTREIKRYNKNQEAVKDFKGQKKD